MQRIKWGGHNRWQQIDRHHAYIMYVQDYVLKAEKRIMLITASIVINISQEQRCDIRIRKRKSWRKLERMRGIRLWNAS